MALATVAYHPSNPNHLHLDSLPLIDLRLLSQSDLYSLSLTSSSSSLSHSTRRFDDDVLIPKIDRSVFNESAGSRKQTYSRLRLAPRNSQFPIPNPKSQKIPHSHSHSQPRDPETLQIITLLKQLFPSEKTANENDDVLVSVPVRLAQYDASPEPSLQIVPAGFSVDVGTKRKRGRPRKDSNVVVAPRSVNADLSVEKLGGDNNTTSGIVVESTEGKRKRGRPRKDDNRAALVKKTERERKAPMVKEARVKEVEVEMVMENRNGVVVDLDALGNGDDLFEEALRRRTEGMETEAQLLGFLGGLEGEWSSARKKRKIVQASELCDALPRQWKILLSLKRNGGHVWLFCRRYISPNGQQFVSCKEVSSYLPSYFGVGSQSKPGQTDGNIQAYNKMVSRDDNLTFKDEINAEELVSGSPTPITCVSTGHDKQENFHREDSWVNQVEVMGMPKKVDPVKADVLQTSLRIHESVQIDREATSDAVANYELNSGFSYGRVNTDIIGNCSGRYNRISMPLSCEEEVMKADKNRKVLGFSEQDGVFNLTNDKLAKVDDATGVGPSYNGHLVNETASHKCSGDTNVFNCFPDRLNDDVMASVSSVDVSKMDADTVLNGMGKESRTVNIDNNQSTSTVGNTKLDDVGYFGYGRSISGISESCIGPEDVYPNVEQQSTSKACSLVPSIMVQSLPESGSERGLFSTSIDEKTRDVCNNFNSESFRMSYEPKFDDVDISGNDKKTIGFGCDHATPRVDATEISEHVISTGSCSNIPPLDGKSCITLSNDNNPSGTVEQLWSENANYPSGTVEHLWSGKSFRSSVSTPIVQRDKGCSETGMVCPSGYSRCYDLVNNVNNTSSSSMEESKKEDVKRSWNNEVLCAFGNSQAGLGANSMASTVHERSSGGPFLGLSENSQTFAAGNNVTGVFSSSVLEDRLIGESGNGLIHPNCSEQTPAFENNLNRAYSTVMWGQHSSEGAERYRNEPMTCFPNHSQPSGDGMAELMWRADEQNAQQSGLDDTSSALMQSSSCYPNFDMLSGKGANEALSVNEKFDNILCLEGVKPSRVEKLDYNFQTTHASSQSKESKVLSYDGGMEQGFNSSAWFEKESLPSMPNIASRRDEIIICVWCRNEFYHDVYEAGPQTSSVGFMCATCQEKIPGQFKIS